MPPETGRSNGFFWGGDLRRVLAVFPSRTFHFTGVAIGKYGIGIIKIGSARPAKREIKFAAEHTETPG